MDHPVAEPTQNQAAIIPRRKFKPKLKKANKNAKTVEQPESGKIAIKLKASEQPEPAKAAVPVKPPARASSVRDNITRSPRNIPTLPQYKLPGPSGGIEDQSSRYAENQHESAFVSMRNYAKNKDKAEILRVIYYHVVKSRNKQFNCNKVDMKHLTEFGWTFSYYSYLIIVDLRGFQLSKECTNLRNMFKYCVNLKHIFGIDKLNVENVEVMDGMFWGCWNLETPDLSHWNTKSLVTCSSMFKECKAMKRFTGENWDMSHAKDLKHMFERSGLEEIDLSHWNLSSCTEIIMIFNNCKNLKRINFSNNTFENHSFDKICNGCNLLEYCNFSYWNMKPLGTCERTFHGCNNLETLLICDWDFDYLLTVNNETLFSMFEGAKAVAKFSSIQEWIRAQRESNEHIKAHPEEFDRKVNEPKPELKVATTVAAAAEPVQVPQEPKQEPESKNAVVAPVQPKPELKVTIDVPVQPKPESKTMTAVPVQVDTPKLKDTDINSVKQVQEPKQQPKLKNAVTVPVKQIQQKPKMVNIQTSPIKEIRPKLVAKYTNTEKTKFVSKKTGSDERIDVNAPYIPPEKPKRAYASTNTINSEPVEPKPAKMKPKLVVDASSIQNVNINAVDTVTKHEYDRTVRHYQRYKSRAEALEKQIKEMQDSNQYINLLTKKLELMSKQNLKEQEEKHKIYMEYEEFKHSVYNLEPPNQTKNDTEIKKLKQRISTLETENTKLINELANLKDVHNSNIMEIRKRFIKVTKV